jgi:hypothetical protein
MLEPLILAFQEISLSHKAVERFYHGLENEENPDYEQKYPAVIMLPASINHSFVNGQLNITYNCIFQVLDILPEDRSTTDIREGLVKTSDIWKDIISRFIIEYKGEEKTINSKLYQMNFEVENSTANALVDYQTYNKIGYEITQPFTISINANYCLTEQLFS